MCRWKGEVPLIRPLCLLNFSVHDDAVEGRLNAQEVAKARDGFGSILPLEWLTFLSRVSPTQQQRVKCFFTEGHHQGSQATTGPSLTPGQSTTRMPRAGPEPGRVSSAEIGGLSLLLFLKSFPDVFNHTHPALSVEASLHSLRLLMKPVFP